jgi:hypothetical protein
VSINIFYTIHNLFKFVFKFCIDFNLSIKLNMGTHCLGSVAAVLVPRDRSHAREMKPKNGKPGPDSVIWALDKVLPEVQPGVARFISYFCLNWCGLGFPVPCVQKSPNSLHSWWDTEWRLPADLTSSRALHFTLHVTENWYLLMWSVEAQEEITRQSKRHSDHRCDWRITWVLIAALDSDFWHPPLASQPQLPKVSHSWRPDIRCPPRATPGVLWVLGVNCCHRSCERGSWWREKLQAC